MKKEVRVPPAGESITEATISAIFKENGASVHVDEELFEMETEKVNQAIYAPATGILHHQLKVGDLVKIDQVIASVTQESLSSPPPKKEPQSPTPAPKASPSSTEREKKPPISSDGRERRERLSGMRKTISKRLVAAKNETAMLTTFNEVDMSHVMQVREKEQSAFQKTHGVKLGFLSFFVKAVVQALKKYPEVQAYLDQEEIVYRNYYDIGIAVGTEKGLFVPVLRDCDKLSFASIEKQLKSLAEEAREGRIALEALQGGGFTITNGGVYGSLLSTPILNPPQSAILGMHAITKRPIAIDDQVVIRPMMYIALSYDHRMIDGKSSIEFLLEIKKQLENAEELFKSQS